MKRFYVYIYFDPRNEEAFYVGKGFGERFKKHLKLTGSNIHLRNRIKSIKNDGFEPIVTMAYAKNEEDAFKQERDLIKTFGRRDLGTGTLCNYTNGGEGSSGRVFTHSEETKEKIRQKLIGREMTEDHRAKIGVARKGHVNSAESIARGAETRLRNMTDDLRSALSAAAKTLMTEKHQKRLTELARQANIGRTKSALTLQRMRDAQRLRRQREASKNVGD